MERRRGLGGFVCVFGRGELIAGQISNLIKSTRFCYNTLEPARLNAPILNNSSKVLIK